MRGDEVAVDRDDQRVGAGRMLVKEVPDPLTDKSALHAIPITGRCSPPTGRRGLIENRSFSAGQRQPFRRQVRRPELKPIQRNSRHCIGFRRIRYAA